MEPWKAARRGPSSCQCHPISLQLMIQFLVSPQVSNLKIILQSLVEYSQDVSNCKGI